MSAAELERVAVLGMGTMGAGIAQVCAQAGLEVVVLEATEEQAASGAERRGARPWRRA